MEMQTMKKTVKFRMFRGIFKTWQKFFEEASEFASTLNHEALINISHSCDQQDAVVTVWYWE
jgi:hypothetical protein